MSARRVHLPPERIGAGRAELTAEARHYLRDVLRLAPGAAVELFDGAGRAWDAILAEGGDALLLGAAREAAARGARVSLLFALAKGEKSDLVVQKATELGVARLAPFAAARSVVRLEAERAQARTARWRRIAEEAARQCGRTDVPELAPPVPLAAALAALPAGQVPVVFQPGGAPLAAVEAGAAGVAAVVGPEGGLDPAELAACAAAGARLATLGPRVLRAETAAIVAVALLQERFGDMG